MEATSQEKQDMMWPSWRNKKFICAFGSAAQFLFQVLPCSKSTAMVYRYCINVEVSVKRVGNATKKELKLLSRNPVVFSESLTMATQLFSCNSMKSLHDYQGQVEIETYNLARKEDFEFTGNHFKLYKGIFKLDACTIMRIQNWPIIKQDFNILYCHPE